MQKEKEEGNFSFLFFIFLPFFLFPDSGTQFPVSICIQEKAVSAGVHFARRDIINTDERIKKAMQKNKSKNKNSKDEMRVLLKEMNQAITDAGFDAELIKNNFESEKLKSRKKYYKENEYGRKVPTKLMDHIKTYHFFYADDATDFLVRIVSSGLTVKDRRAGMPKSASEDEWRRSADIINERNRTAYEKVIKAKKEKREKEEEFFNSIDNDEKALTLLIERAKIDSIDEMYKRKDFRTAIAMYKLVDGYAVCNASITVAERLAEFRKKYSFKDIINFLAFSVTEIESAEKYIALAVICEAAKHHQAWLSSEWVAIKAIGCHEYGKEDFFDLCDDYDNDESKRLII